MSIICFLFLNSNNKYVFYPCPVGTFCHIVGLHQLMGFSSDIVLEISMCIETIKLYIIPVILYAILNLSKIFQIASINAYCTIPSASEMSGMTLPTQSVSFV